MKKAFRFFVAAALVLGIAASCGKDNGAKTPDDDSQEQPSDNPTDNPSKPEGPVYPITVDGDDSDWAALDQSYVVTLTAPEGRTAGHDLIRSAKIYVDPDYINIYFTFRDTITQAVKHNLYVDFDNSDETGGYDNQFTDPNSEASFQGEIRKAGTKEFSSISGTLYEWSGAVGGKYTDPNTGELKNNWEWTSIMSYSAVASGAGKELGGGISAYEYQICLSSADEDSLPINELYTINSTEIGIGLDILSLWTDVGCLPIGVDALAPKAKVKIAPAFKAE